MSFLQATLAQWSTGAGSALCQTDFQGQRKIMGGTGSDEEGRLLETSVAKYALSLAKLSFLFPQVFRTTKDWCWPGGATLGNSKSGHAILV